MSPKLDVGLPTIWVAVIAALGAAALLKGGLYLNGSEADAVHLIQVIALMADGLVPHTDFMTPTGALAFRPIALGLEREWPIGMSFHWAQTSIALTMVPLLWWTAVSRLHFRLGLWFGIAALVLVMALADGHGQQLSISGYHGRWGWAFAFIAVLIAVLEPNHRRGATLDGIALGACLSALALLEIAFFIGVAPGVVFAMAMRRQLLAITVAILTGAVITMSANAVFGPTILWDYLGDLLRVSAAPALHGPNAGFPETLISPRFIAEAILLATAVWALRRVVRRAEAAVLTLLAPGFLWIDFSTQADVPLWPLVLAVALLAAHPRKTFAEGRGFNPAVAAVAFASAMAAAGPWIDFTAGAFRHFSANPSDYVQSLPELPMARDIHFARSLVEDPEVAIRRSPRIGLDARPGTAPRDVAFLGEHLPRCRAGGDIIGTQRRLAASAAAKAPIENTRIFVADVFSALWLVGGGEPVEGIAPRNHGEPLGIDTADYLVVPLSMRPDVRKEILARMEAEFADRLDEVARGEAMILYSVDR